MSKRQRKIQEQIMDKIRSRYKGQCAGCPFVVKCFETNQKLCKEES